MNILKLLAPLDLQECNCHYQKLVEQRIESLAKLTGREVHDLTLRELVSCVEAANNDYAELTPTIFPGAAPWTPQPLGAIV